MEEDFPVSGLKTEVNNMSSNSRDVRNNEHQIPNVPFTGIVSKDIKPEPKESQAVIEEGGNDSFGAMNPANMDTNIFT